MKHALPRINDWLNLDSVKQHYPEALLVGEFPIKHGSEYSGVLFWQPNPPHDYSNYFMLCPSIGVIDGKITITGVYITSGETQSQQVYTGVITPKGDFIYSRHRHDYIEHDGCVIDGGDSYVRSNGVGKQVRFLIEQDKITIRQ